MLTMSKASPQSSLIARDTAGLLSSPSSIVKSSARQTSGFIPSTKHRPATEGPASQVSSQNHPKHVSPKRQADGFAPVEGKSGLMKKLRSLFSVSKHSSQTVPSSTSSHDQPMPEALSPPSVPVNLPAVQPFIWPSAVGGTTAASQTRTASHPVPLSQSPEQLPQHFAEASAAQVYTSSFSNPVTYSPPAHRVPAYHSSRRNMAVRGDVSATSSTSDYADVPSRLPHHSPGYSPFPVTGDSGYSRQPRSS